MRFGLLGEKLSHSYSKDIHEAIGKYPYELIELSQAEFPLFMQQKDFTAVNVTIPYKQKVIPYLDVVDPLVERIGACNCVVNRNGKLYGYNTDYLGVRKLLAHNSISLKGKKVVILGTGGTSHTVKEVCVDEGACWIKKVSRNKKDDVLTYEELKNQKDIDVIINTTPREMYPNLEENILSLEDFPSLQAVVDVVYNPLRTNLLIQAKSKGVKYCSGLYMLVAQAYYAVQLFLDKELDESLLEKEYQHLLLEKENIVLIGMPTSGKTTIGKKLSTLLRLPFYDVDHEIENNLGMEVPTFISEKGEEAFRKIESEVIAKLSLKNGAIISTGGGSILRKENVVRLSHYGKLFFLNRSLENLQVSSSRPLSSSKEDLKKRYLERYDKYLSVADEVINGDEGIADICAEIIRRRNK